MTTKSIIHLTALTLGLSSTLCLADRAADLKPTLAKPGKLVVDENFSGSSLAKGWTVAKGEWKISDGTLVGQEKKSDQHPAVLSLGHPEHNSIIQFSFKLDGAKGFNLSYNSAKGGHLFRIAINDDGLVMNKDKDKKDPKSKNLELGKAAGKFEAGKWYTMMVEIQGGQVAVQTDNGVKLTGKNAELDVDKTGYRFVTRGSSLLLGDIKVWELAP